MSCQDYIKKQLIHIRNPLEPGDTPLPITLMVDEFDTSEIKIPPFQRDYIWHERQVKDWIDHIRTSQDKPKPIGTIVIYQIRDDYSQKFVADGRQRLQATSNYIKNPEALGFNESVEQARIFCKTFIHTFQNRIYDDHRQAMDYFQRVNMGTNMTPAEYHKGDLVIDSKVGEFIYSHIQTVMEEIQGKLLSSRKLDRQAMSRKIRDNLGLFYQYITDHTGMSFWDVTKRQEVDEKSIEDLIFDYIKMERLTQKMALEQIGYFKKFMDSEVATLRELILGLNFEHDIMVFSPGILHWIFHLALWRKNNKVPVEPYKSFVELLLKHTKRAKQFKSQFAIDDDGEQDVITIKIDDIGSHLHRLCRVFNVALNEMTNQNRPPSIAPPGYHVSHEKPYRDYGNGETFFEAGTSNLSRGAKPVENR